MWVPSDSIMHSEPYAFVRALSGASRRKIQLSRVAVSQNLESFLPHPRLGPAMSAAQYSLLRNLSLTDNGPDHEENLIVSYSSYLNGSANKRTMKTVK
jgi:hypothetical protein